MVKMSAPGHDSDDSEDTVSSSECSEDESSENDSSDTASLKSLKFSVKPRNSKVTVKSKKSNKRVRFKPGDSLVLVYIIPNREMLGLKSESEDSDGTDDDSDDEDSDGVDDDDDDEDDDDDADTDNDDDDDDDDDGESKAKNKTNKQQKPFAKLIAVKQVKRRKTPELKTNVKPVEKVKEDIPVTNTTQAKGRKLLRARPRRERKENVKVNKTKDLSVDNRKNKSKQYKTNNAIKVEKRTRGKRNRSRVLEIRATVESNRQETNSVLPKVTFKSDIKPAVIDVNSTVSSKQLTNRTRLQPTSFRISKPGSRPNSAGAVVSHSMTSLPAKKSVGHLVASNYGSLSSVLPDSYVRVQSLQDNTVEETIKRLDPDSMNTSGKRNYGWQIANGTITSQSLRTPSILPFWDSLQNSVSDNNTIKLPT